MNPRICHWSVTRENWQRAAPIARARDNDSAAEKQSVHQAMPFSYNSSDGRKKASLEDALSKGKNRSVLMDRQPWQVGWQMAERNLMWNDQVAAALVKVISCLCHEFGHCPKSSVSSLSFSLCCKIQ